MKCLSIVICESVTEDLKTRNKTYKDIFNMMYVESFPARHKKMCIVCSLTDLPKRCKMILSFKIDETGEEICSVHGEIRSINPLYVLDLVFTVKNIPLAKSGNYSIELQLDDDYIASRRFTVVDTPALNELIKRGALTNAKD